MKKFSKLFTALSFISAVAVTVALTSCGDDDGDPSFANPTIAATASNSAVVPGGTATISIAVTAEAGLASVTMGNESVKTYTTDSKADAFTYEYDVPQDQTENIELTFTVTDKQGTPKTAQATVSLTISGKPTVEVASNISAPTTTWTADKYYLLKGNIYVESGAELTIEEGTVILGDKATKGALIVSRGAKIHAVGTADAPIVFTSSAPAGFRNYGDWGGVVILGKAANNQSADQTIEGITAASGDNGKYGGAANDDDSGELNYVRIEFAGIALSTDNELNGITFGSVGSETDVHHIQVSYSGDDSFEWFGGTVNSKYLVAYRGWDDDFDTDFGYSGENQFLVSFRDPNIADKSGSNGFESDNDGSGTGNTPLTSAKFANVTFFGPWVYANLSGGALSASNISSNYQNGAHIRRNSALQVYNSAFVGWGRTNGVLFQTTNAAAVFKGNYIGRILGPAMTASNPATVPFSTATFTTDNTIEATLGTVDLSAKFAGLTAAGNLSAPGALLAAGSPLLTAGTTFPTDGTLEATDYVGAFDATNNWLTGWTEFDPNNKVY